LDAKNIRPSQRQNRNLTILVLSRKGYFTYKGLYPYLLSTYFFYIKEEARIPLTKVLLPIIDDNNNRSILERAVNSQGKWEPLKAFESSWTFFRKLGMGSIKNQQVEDLLQLDYYRLLDGMQIPDKAKLSLFWGGLVDFLVNTWSILEEFWLVIGIEEKLKEEEKKREEQIQNEGGTPLPEQNSPWKKLIYWPDMQLEHHLINILLRLRAGWDKLADYVIAEYYGITHAKTWETRINKLDREIQPIINDKQIMFWKNWIENARAISNGLRVARDFELHKIAVRVKETLGNPKYTYSMNDLENFVLFEHFRLQESFLLILAMIRSV